MNHILLNSEIDRWKLAYSYIKIKMGDDSIWREEDLPKLEPFFKYSEQFRGGEKNRPMTQEEKDSFDYYEKCNKEYSDELKEKRDSVLNIDIYTLVRALGYEMPPDEDEEGNEIEDYQIYEEVPLKSSFELSYPCICINWIESSYDRMSGNNGICCVDYVELKEFDKKN